MAKIEMSVTPVRRRSGANSPPRDAPDAQPNARGHPPGQDDHQQDAHHWEGDHLGVLEVGAHLAVNSRVDREITADTYLERGRRNQRQ
jgi:hypothetical protein